MLFKLEERALAPDSTPIEQIKYNPGLYGWEKKNSCPQNGKSLDTFTYYISGPMSHGNDEQWHGLRFEASP